MRFIQQLSFACVCILLAACATAEPESPQNANQQMSVSAWKTYSNTEHHFSIQYPPNWITERTAGGSPDYDFIGFGPPESKQGGMIWGVEVYTLRDGETFLERVDALESPLKSTLLARDLIPISGVGGIHTVRELGLEGETLRFEAVYLGVQDRVFKIDNGGATREESFRTFVESFHVES